MRLIYWYNIGILLFFSTNLINLYKSIQETTFQDLNPNNELPAFIDLTLDER